MGEYLRPQAQKVIKSDPFAYEVVVPQATLALSDQAQRTPSVLSVIDSLLTRNDADLTTARRLLKNNGSGVPDRGLPRRLAETRDIFLAESSKKEKKAVAYDLEMDAVLYRVLKTQEGELEYEASKQALDAYVKMQLETHIGERLNVGISRFVYTIVDGQLLSEHTNEPALEMIRRGRDYRRNHGKLTDREREDAEVIGFARIQEVLADDKTPVGAMMLFVSPPGDLAKGSNYPSNVYELHIKVAPGKSEAIRFTSGLNASESQERLSFFDPWYKRKTVPTDAEFIAHPVLIDPLRTGLKTPEDVHNFMHRDHKHLNQADFELIKKACEPLIQRFIDTLTNNPDDLPAHALELRRVQNYADNSHNNLTLLQQSRNGSDYKKDAYDTRPWVAPRIDLDALGRQKVRFVAGGCGSSGDSQSASSVADFDPDRKGNSCNTCGQKSADNHYHCPDCSRSYADESAKAPEDMTKQCGCGFEFDCGKSSGSKSVNDNVDKTSLALAA